METEELPDLLKNEHLRKLPFRVPEGYFAQLETAIDQRIEPVEIPASAQDETLWQVPEGYFSKLEAEIGQKLDTELAKARPKVVPIWSQWTNWAAAASIALIVYFGYIALFQQKQVQTTIPELATQDIVQYLLDNPGYANTEMQNWLAVQNGQPQNEEWLEHIDNETLEIQLENYEDEIFEN